ncbi:hydroquinone glucosyltransferase-like [Senna tora]|uniref:Glycosyltransferase n=1 Tax=Senna tora TaxID=362788 RepID=A0A834XH22_9FABA|nr:hydroquinone glucosyltransferase-like [Senna tora]
MHSHGPLSRSKPSHPTINPHDLPPNAHPASLMFLTVTHSLPSLSQALTSLTASSHTRRLVALVLDTFSADAVEVARRFGLPAYVYHPSSATALAFTFYYPSLDEDEIVISRKFGELVLSEPLRLPGCMPFDARDLSDLVQDTSSDFHATLVHLCKRIRHADGVIVNSFLHLEASPIKALQNGKNPPVYPVGPIVQLSSSNSSSSECLAWLDDQPENSVLYVSFGSGGTLSYEQFDELAYGLEMSGHRFLWVVRAPNGSALSGYLNPQKEDPFEYLPKGFRDRTQGRGFVVKSWAPQVEVLRHGSTCGFLTHCGWNSTLESVMSGKPLIAWPLFAEQRLNAAVLSGEFKVALRPRVNEKGIVEREEVSRVVKCVIEGEEGKEMGKRMGVFKDAAISALSKDGSSTRTLETLATKWRNMEI